MHYFQLQDTTFGNQEALAGLMREFFILYPGAKYAYSVASALSGFHGLRQHHGTTLVTSKCIWVPYFQGVFYCHDSVKVHFDVTSTLHHSTLAVYDNDTGEKLPQAYNAHKIFHFRPNMHGYVEYFQFVGLPTLIIHFVIKPTWYTKWF